MKIVNEGNQMKCYSNEELLLTITELGNNCFMTENDRYKIKGEVTTNGNASQLTLLEFKKKGKDGRWRKNKRDRSAQSSWFIWILSEYGYTTKTKTNIKTYLDNV